jgi:hypothetical protein
MAIRLSEYYEKISPKDAARASAAHRIVSIAFGVQRFEPSIIELLAEYLKMR